ncbi:unnamed protein product [Zymoseptoria tritici ST99CH_3D7]|uniref:Uncharacterized protein n=1 Tax=Zymoseptoria tritici (strain ST99CH_3D7) TaxID=1276538 RepID=A0A1X7S3E7_ZYMT9|nr:unnamed protein product [Zymoseptoria tritici ST99CH_3D7]
MLFIPITALMARAARLVQVQGQNTTSAQVYVCPTTLTKPNPMNACTSTVFGSTTAEGVDCGGCKTLVTSTLQETRFHYGRGFQCPLYTPIPTVTKELTTVTSCEPSIDIPRCYRPNC